MRCPDIFLLIYKYESNPSNFVMYMQLYIHLFLYIKINCKGKYFTKNERINSLTPLIHIVLNIFNKVFDNINVQIIVKNEL